MGRYIGFIENLAKSKKSLLKLIFNSCSSDHSSLTGQNLAHILQKYGKSSVKELTMNKQSIKTAQVYPLQNDEVWKTDLIKEITVIKIGLLDIEFDLDNLNEILEHICTEQTCWSVGVCWARPGLDLAFHKTATPPTETRI